MRNIILVGSGNVATHLGIALQNCHYKIVQVYSRSIKNAKKLAQKLNTDFTNDLTQLKDANLIIVSVNDDAISDVLSQLKNTGKFNIKRSTWGTTITDQVAIAHTSGSVGLDVFNKGDFQLGNNFADFGVLYPIQTFNKEVDINMSEVPFCIEGNSLKFENQLTQIAKRISNTVVVMDSEQRKQLHIAAVFASNFSNQMFTIADDLLAERNIDFKILLPLIKQTIAKLNTNKPKEVQTGPAKRKDKKIIQEHIDLIQEKKIKELYKKISTNIIKTHE